MHFIRFVQLSLWGGWLVDPNPTHEPRLTSRGGSTVAGDPPNKLKADL